MKAKEWGWVVTTNFRGFGARVGNGSGLALKIAGHQIELNYKSGKPCQRDTPSNWASNSGFWSKDDAFCACATLPRSSTTAWSEMASTA